MAVMKRAVIASGGTGGHFYPGFALAQELRARGWQTLFLVKKDDIARPALEEADFPYAELDMVPLPRSLNPLAHARFLWKFLSSVLLARRVMKDFAPDAVVGTGSYVGFPALAAARLAGVPLYLHESNAKFGLGNRVAGLFCTRAALGLPVQGNPFAAKSALTGTPIREAFREPADRGEARRKLGLDHGEFTVLVFGGSQGARRLNNAFIAAFKALKGDIQAVHVTGRKNYDAVLDAYSEAGLDGAPNLKVFDYREDMPLLYAASDLVISRSGASTVAELVHLRKPAVLVPLPSSAGGHQKANAMALALKGAAVCLDEGEDFDAALATAVRSFTEEPDRLSAMQAALGSTGVPDGMQAAAALADMIEADKR